MRSNTSLLGKILMGIALRLEILTKILRIIFSQNLSVYSVCSVDPCTLCVPWIRVLCVFRGSVKGGNEKKHLAPLLKQDAL